MSIVYRAYSLVKTISVTQLQKKVSQFLKKIECRLFLKHSYSPQLLLISTVICRDMHRLKV